MLWVQSSFLDNLGKFHHSLFFLLKNKKQSNKHKCNINNSENNNNNNDFLKSFNLFLLAWSSLWNFALENLKELKVTDCLVAILVLDERREELLLERICLTNDVNLEKEKEMRRDE